MPRYLVESYARASAASDLAVNVRMIVERFAGEGVRFLRSTFIPEDEMCLIVLESPSIETIQEIARRSLLPSPRVVEAVEALEEPRP